jgi:DNA-binding CsgD family transcriptional regulator
MGRLMLRNVILYGFALASLVVVMKVVQYRYFVRDLSLEFYLGIVALVFLGLGVWAGFRTSSRKLVAPPAEPDPAVLESTGISRRELEVLRLIAAGHSNREIADKLFLSLNTVKTHTSNVFSKLNVSRRTQAIRKAKELGLLG